MKAKKYFNEEYGNDHIKDVVDLKDLESLYGLMQEYADEQLRLHNVISWVALAEFYPKPETELIMYREDAGVFFGYYGSLEESLPDDQKEHLYEQGLTEEDIFENRFYYYDMAGNGLLELDTLPQFWAECPKPPCL